VGERLKIGLDLVYLVEDSGGSARYARELIPALLAAEPGIEITAWVGSTAPSSLSEEHWAGEVRWVRLPVPGVGSPWHLWYELGAIGVSARRRKLDVVHGLAYLAPIVHPGVATVVTIHDVIWLSHPEATDRRFRTAMRVLTPILGRTSDRVIAISDAAREDIVAALRLDPEKFDVAPHGITMPPPVPPDAEETDRGVRERFGFGPQPILLCVAAKRRHKNLHGLIEALALVPEPRPQLVLPGTPNDYELELRELADRLGLRETVHFPGWVSDRDLESLYRAASCFALPSFQEGFGLPVLEAMARGLPVACSDIPALREVVGDAAELFDPHDPSSIARAIARVGDRANALELVRLGTERCRSFTWRRTAELTLASYRRALER